MAIIATTLSEDTPLNFTHVRKYWMLLAVSCIALLAVALYYQYALGDEPCQVCIQARLWVVALLLVSIMGLALPQHGFGQWLALALALVSCVGLGERGWFLYLLENGRGDGSCEFQLGMPDWFAVDRWFPDLFEVRNLCSFTPNLPLGLTMAEGLVLAALALAVIVALAAINNARKPTP